VNKEEGPDPSDIAAWREAINSQSLSRILGHRLVAAAQHIGPSGEKRVVNALMNEITERIMRILRRHIGRNHRNEGWDLIEEAHGKLIDAVLLPESADGKRMRTAFVTTVKFRAADAIRRGKLDSDRYAYSEAEAPREGGHDDLSSPPEECAHIDSVLNRIADPRKRLAFQLHLDGVPRNSSKVESIASALGVSAKTAETWVKETEEEIKAILGAKP
jgi:DNA-directed RNA polymerase specialized sigma24 family protein